MTCGKSYTYINTPRSGNLGEQIPTKSLEDDQHMHTQPQPQGRSNRRYLQC